MEVKKQQIIVSLIYKTDYNIVRHIISKIHWIQNKLFWHSTN